jgi:HSP20 family protein
MWADACEMLERAERLQRQFFRPGGRSARLPVWEPPVDMVDNGRELVIMVALPGVDPGRLEAVIDQGAFIVAAERPLPLGPGTREVHRLEIPHGRFERRVPLPPGEYTLGQRELVNGCLTVILRRLR